MNLSWEEISLVCGEMHSSIVMSKAIVRNVVESYCIKWVLSYAIVHD